MTASSETSASPEVLQKLLMPWLARGVVEQGYYSVAGPVTRSVDVAGLSPGELVAAHGLAGAEGPYGADVDRVYVLRFEVDPLMRLERPAQRGPRPWPTYESGFLAGSSLAPVWLLERTRVPVGTELRRLSVDGSEQLLAVYYGPAAGWKGATGYFPPVHLVGPRALWDGLDLPAALVPGTGNVELVFVGEVPPRSGFEQVRPGVWRVVRPLAEVDRVFDLVLACRWQGVLCRILQQASGNVRLLLLDDEPAVVAALRGEEVEPGVFELTAPSAAIADVQGATRQLGGA